MNSLRDRRPDDAVPPAPVLDAFAVAVLFVLFAAVATVGAIAALRLATACEPAPRPPHFAPAASGQFAEWRP